jgi:mannose-6-phosphate isomerase-like protein (cupin superfamily)
VQLKLSRRRAPRRSCAHSVAALDSEKGLVQCFCWLQPPIAGSSRSAAQLVATQWGKMRLPLRVCCAPAVPANVTARPWRWNASSTSMTPTITNSDLNITRVTFPAQMPSNPPHHRSGAALYYIISGTGANTVDGKTQARGPGSLIYEPYALVYQ